MADSAPLQATDSLAAALQLLLRKAGRNVLAEDLLAATGVAFSTVATSSLDPGDWLQAGRDLWLLPGASHFGLRLRELHPLDAAAGVLGVPEYQEHFADSYVPLIVRALDHRQTVMARGGWPAPAEKNWGVVLEHRHGKELRGVVQGHRDPVPLARAAAQCYVVEEVNAVQVSEAELARSASVACRRYRTAPYPLDLVVGASAWAKWHAFAASASATELGRLAPAARELHVLRMHAEQVARRWSEGPLPRSSEWRTVQEVAGRMVAVLAELDEVLLRGVSADRSRVLGLLKKVASSDARLQDTLAALDISQSQPMAEV